MIRSIRTFAGVACLALLACAAFAQGSSDKPAAPPPAPAFDVADIHRSPYSFQSVYFRTSPPGTDRYTIHQGTLLDIVAAAYSLDQDHVLGGPTWLDFDRFDIAAKQPASTSPETAKLMLRSLLADRFALVVHTDTRPMPAQVLSLDKGGPKMKPAADTSVSSQCQFHPPATPPEPGAPPPTAYNFSCRNMTMEKYATNLPRFGANRAAIVDQTGLKGAWDFDVTYTMLPSRNGLDLENDLAKLGLKLAPGVTPQQVLIVDSANRTPAPNSPEVARLLPPPAPPAFDVAVIKPSPPGTRNMQIMFRPDGQVNISGATLQALLSEAYDISGAMIADIPDFLGKDHWDILGKVSQDAYPKRPDGSPNVSFDDIKLMLRSLLEERFQLKAHFEDRPAQAYVLSAANPKLKKTADPKARTSCDNTPLPGEKDPRTTDPIRERLMVCRNVTMTEFAALLGIADLDYIKSPVLDATHLEGSYDITLNWSRSRVARGVEGIGGQPVAARNPNAPAGDAQEPTEPTGAISLPDAISKQLGLKLELQKRPVPLLVLDHIQQEPTEN